MADVSAALVKELRDKTGAGMMDCKRALGDTGGDIEAAVDWLRTKGLAAAAKKSGRIAAEGLVGVATQGGRFPPAWRELLKSCIAKGLDLENGLHEFISDDAELSVGGAVAMGYVTNAQAVDRDFILSARYEIGIAGRRYPAKAWLRPPYDPHRKRILA